MCVCMTKTHNLFAMLSVTEAPSLGDQCDLDVARSTSERPKCVRGTKDVSVMSPAVQRRCSSRSRRRDWVTGQLSQDGGTGQLGHPT
jgi:hypothetical protein